MTTQEMSQKVEQVPLVWRIVLFITLFLCVYLAIMVILEKPIARHKAKNPKNILQGCLYDTGDRSKYGQPVVRIDEYRVAIPNMMVKEFPAFSKVQYVEFDLKKFSTKYCYKVKYIIVDFNVFTDSKYLKWYSIYDYVDY